MLVALGTLERPRPEGHCGFPLKEGFCFQRRDERYRTGRLTEAVMALMSCLEATFLPGFD